MIPSTGAAIAIENVTKVYQGRIHALQGISLNVNRGEIFGLLGPNGAGKSTLIKIMMAVVRPTNAQGTILGQSVGHKPTLARVGYLPEHHRFPRYLTGRQTLEFFAALTGVNRAARKRRSAELVETVGMTAWADKKVGDYSKGMMQRIGLAQALVNDPDLVLLDEPTDGVDPVGRRDIRQVLLRMRDLGKTVFVNSHLLSELELMCDRVAILVGGKVARQGKVDELNVAKQRYEIEVVPPPNDRRALQRSLSGCVVAELPPAGAISQTPVLNYFPRSRKSVENQATWAEADANAIDDFAAVAANGLETGKKIPIEIFDHLVRLGTMDPAPVQDILDAIRAAGLSIRRVQAVRPSLEDLYMDAVVDPTTGRPSAGAGASLRPPPLRAFPIEAPLPVISK